MRTLLTTSTSVTVTFDIDPDPETWGSRKGDQCDIFKMITCSTGQWPVSLDSTILPPTAHLDAYAFTCFWLERLASVIEEMTPIYFKQHFLPLLPDHLLQDHDPVSQLALRLYRPQSTIPPPSWRDNLKPRKSSADYANFEDWTSFAAAVPQAYQVALYLEVNAQWLLRTKRA